jgi:dolichyl-phosphate-mannose-protein mannosyltransferase
VQITRKILVTSTILYLLSQILFLINIQFPRTHNFDEFHYIPAAKQYLEFEQRANLEHPPLGKMLMAVGVAAWGDQPMGWRFMSTVFGALTLVGMYILGWILFADGTTALWIAILTLSNQLLYVQSRIGMLDTFMFGFLVWAIALFCWTWLPGVSLKATRRLFRLSGLFFGLSLACKWFAIVPWVACCALVGLVRLLQKWRTHFGHPSSHDWFRPAQWKDLSGAFLLFSFVLIPLFAYFLTFFPMFFLFERGHSFSELFTVQAKMWGEQLRVVSSHPYMSNWLDWPLLHRPIWYAFDHEGATNEWVRGVILIGNPLVMWSGLLALLYVLWDFITKRNREAFLILFFYSVFYFCWAIIPRKVSFYYYYYPAGMFLSFALAYVYQARPLEKMPWLRWVFLGVSCGVFVYFFPILAGLKIPAQDFRKWMWFRSWI